MKIIPKNQALHVEKPEGTIVDYHMREEYEIHYNEMIPGTIQKWHHHTKISEIILILEGELTLKWKENDEMHEQIVRHGDLIELENSSHTLFNHTNKNVKLVVLKLILSGESKEHLFKNDKVLDE